MKRADGMRVRTFVALLVLVLAAPAVAQAPEERVTPYVVQGVTALVIVDARNVVVGSVLGFGSIAFGSGPFVILRETTHLARVYVFPGVLQGDNYPLFSTYDCTGTVYVRSAPHDPAFDLIASVALFDHGVYQPRPGTTRRSIPVRAYGGSDGDCAPLPPAFVYREDLYPAVRVMDLTGRWAPPFRIR